MKSICKYSMICSNSNTCDGKFHKNCGSYKLLEHYTKDKFKEFLNKLRVENLLEYKEVQALILLTKKKLENGINIIDGGTLVYRENPIWFIAYVEFDDNTSLSAGVDDYEDELSKSWLSETINYDIDNILVQHK